MRADDIEAALARGAWVSPPSQPSPVQSMGAAIADAIEECALALAHRHRLIDQEGQLHCWHCGGPIGWHASLQCVLCRRDAPRRKREQDERERAHRERQRLEELREQEQSRPVQRVANRSFRDD